LYAVDSDSRAAWFIHCLQGSLSAIFVEYLGRLLTAECFYTAVNYDDLMLRSHGGVTC